jgi:hypothetical protein
LFDIGNSNVLMSGNSVIIARAVRANTETVQTVQQKKVMKDFKETLTSPGKVAATALIAAVAAVGAVYLWEKHIAPKVAEKFQKDVSVTN